MIASLRDGRTHVQISGYTIKESKFGLVDFAFPFFTKLDYIFTTVSKYTENCSRINLTIGRKGWLRPTVQQYVTPNNICQAGLIYKKLGDAYCWADIVVRG